MHGQFYRHFERPSVDNEKTLAGLCSSDVEGETESLTFAATDKTLNTRY